MKLPVFNKVSVWLSFLFAELPEELALQNPKDIENEVDIVETDNNEETVVSFKLKYLGMCIIALFKVLLAFYEVSETLRVVQ